MVRKRIGILTSFVALAVATAAHSAAPPLGPTADPLPPGALARLGSARLRHGGLVRAVGFSPDGALLASASHDRTVSLWEVPTGSERLRLRGHDGDVLALAFAPNGTLLASAAADSTVRLWALRGKDAGKEVRRFTFRADSVDGLAWSPDGKTLAAAGEGVLFLWGAVRRQPIRRLSQERGVRCLAWSGDGKLLASTGEARAVALWSLSTDKVVRTFGDEGVNCLSFSPQGHTLVTWEEGGVFRLWDADWGRQVRTWGAPSSAERGPVYQVAFSPDGKAVAADSTDGSIGLWDPATGKRGQRLVGHAGRCTLRQLAAAPGAEHLRTPRAVEVPERIGTREARAVLAALAAGAPEADLTRDARSALKRLGEKAP